MTFLFVQRKSFEIFVYFDQLFMFSIQHLIIAANLPDRPLHILG